MSPRGSRRRRPTPRRRRRRSRVLSRIERDFKEAPWSGDQNAATHIVEFEQGGEDRAHYGEAIISALAAELTQAHGRGFSERNLLNFRAFYRVFPNSADASAELTWSHFVRLLRVENDLAGRFYVKQSILDGWSTRELWGELVQGGTRALSRGERDFKDSCALVSSQERGRGGERGLVS